MRARLNCNQTRKIQLGYDKGMELCDGLSGWKSRGGGGDGVRVEGWVLSGR